MSSVQQARTAVVIHEPFFFFFFSSFFFFFLLFSGTHSFVGWFLGHGGL